MWVCLKFMLWLRAATEFMTLANCYLQSPVYKLLDNFKISLMSVNNQDNYVLLNQTHIDLAHWYMSAPQDINNCSCKTKLY